MRYCKGILLWDRRLIHYAAEPLGELYDVDQREARAHFKPKGLWVSVEGKDDWETWCESEGFALERLSVSHEIVLDPSANILWLTSAIDIDLLTADYGIDILPGFQYGPCFMHVDWPAISDRYDGIVIAPYQWSRRLDGNARWYYSWDCAAGCIWRKRAIISVIQH